MDDAIKILFKVACEVTRWARVLFKKTKLVIAHFAYIARKTARTLHQQYASN
jgi:hypothetical protein